jgi:hypothetical protein
MDTPEIMNVTISASRWDRERGLTHVLILSGDGWGQGFGTYSLSGPACADWITKLMQVLDLYSMEDKDLIGKVIRVKKIPFGEILAIGHPIKDQWLDPKEFFSKRKQALYNEYREMESRSTLERMGLG